MQHAQLAVPKLAQPTRARLRLVSALVFALGLVAGLGWGQAAVIEDVTYFDGLAHTLITFEIDGDGNDVLVPSGTDLAMPADEYLPRGITFDPAINWLNDGGADFDNAQAIGGSLENSIPSPPQDDFRIGFLKPSTAFGFWVVNSTSSAVPPRFTAFDAEDLVIEQVAFTAALIDGTIGTAQYGFLGIASETPIASVRIELNAAILDDLRFVTIPEPGGLVLGLLAGIALIGRRR